MRYLWLAAAILSEVIGTSSLKAADGFTRLWPSVVVVLGYSAAFYCLSQTLRSIPIGVVYAVWSGVGTALIVLIGAAVYRQRLDAGAFAGIGLILAGVLVLHLFSRSMVN